MGFFEDDEILEDFLVEAGEILEQLSEQLVALERQPEDSALLHAIFRGFHTVKGGAGFLQLTPLVDCCHVTENLFDQLRNGKRQVTPELMDTVLQVLDTVMDMFAAVKDRRPLAPADPALMAALDGLVAGRASAPEPVAEPAALPADEDMTDEEFEQLLAALDAADFEAEAKAADESIAEGVQQSMPDGQPAATDDEITEAEFEALLDQLRGEPSGDTALPVDVIRGADEEEMTDAEFESLLDQLHGSGQHQGVPEPQIDVELPMMPVESSPAEHTTADRRGAGNPPVAVNAQYDARPGSGGAVQGTPAGGAQNRGQPRGATASAPRSATAEAETTVRVDTRRLDDIMNMVGELVLVRNRLVRIGSSATDELLSKTIANLDLVTADLQASVMKTRMQPIRKVFGRFPRLVRDLARSLHKEVNLELRGEDTDLDKNLVEALADPLVHLVRNAVDHGIELPDNRAAAGKGRQGNILLSAEQEGDHILLVIKDDGAGMDADVLRRKAIEKGLMDPEAAARLTPEECFNLIFAPGFSTRAQVSDVSGRGVGMDVVRTRISQLSGSVSIDSVPGEGSRIDIKVPLTLAIMPTLMIMVGQQTFALPLASVSEIFNVDLGSTHVVDGQQVVTVRDKALPLFHLQRWLGNTPEAVNDAAAEVNVVIVTVGAQRVGFVVDTLIGQEEVVIKPLGRMLHGTPGMAGATITGDGGIAIILDVPGLLKQYAA